MDPRKPAPPKVVSFGGGKPNPVADYNAGLVERVKANAAANKVPIPNLMAAAANYQPGKDQPMTLSQMAGAQQNILNMTEDPTRPKLSPETVAGLQHLQQQAQAAHATATPAPTAAPGPSTSKFTTEEARRLEETSDMDFDLMLARMSSDAINNEEERKAVEARVAPMSLADGLVSNEWTQHVPIKPGVLNVTFRSTTGVEAESLRQLVLLETQDNPKAASMAGERLGFFQVVAAIKMINGQEYANHLVFNGTTQVFDKDIFMSKVNALSMKPALLIHSLQVHAYWFDRRVRDLFSTTALKNG